MEEINQFFKCFANIEIETNIEIEIIIFSYWQI